MNWIVFRKGLLYCHSFTSVLEVYWADALKSRIGNAHLDKTCAVPRSIHFTTYGCLQFHKLDSRTFLHGARIPVIFNQNFATSAPFRRREPTAPR